VAPVPPLAIAKAPDPVPKPKSFLKDVLPVNAVLPVPPCATGKVPHCKSPLAEVA